MSVLDTHYPRTNENIEMWTAHVPPGPSLIVVMNCPT
jgi:hypothetical protein